MLKLPNIKQRTTGRIATTQITNELAAAVNGLSPVLETGQVDIALRQLGIYKLRNDTGDMLNNCDIVGLDAPLNLPTDDLSAFLSDIGFVGVTPTAPDHYSHWGVVVGAIDDGDCGYVQVHGLAKVQVDVTDLNHYNAGIVDGDSSHLTSGHVAVARMLFEPPATGLQWMYVSLCNTFRTRRCSGT